MIFVLIIILAAALMVIVLHLSAYAIRWVFESRASGDERGITEVPFSAVFPIFAEILCSFAEMGLSALDLLMRLGKISWRRKIPDRAGLARVEPEVSPSPSGEPRPIVLLHGAGMRGLGMYPLARRLRAEGRTVHLFTYWPPGQSMGAYARQLKDFLESLRREHGYIDFDAAGHSLGGLVLRRYLAVYPGGPAIKRLVTIGTPHGGSELWRFLPSKFGRELRPGGAYLKALDQAGLPPGVELTAISSDFDQLVVPNALAQWKAPTVSNFTISNSGHVRLVFHPETFRIVREAFS